MSENRFSCSLSDMTLEQSPYQNKRQDKINEVSFSMIAKSSIISNIKKDLDSNINNYSVFELAKKRQQLSELLKAIKNKKYDFSKVIELVVLIIAPSEQKAEEYNPLFLERKIKEIDVSLLRKKCIIGDDFVKKRFQSSVEHIMLVQNNSIRVEPTTKSSFMLREFTGLENQYNYCLQLLNIASDCNNIEMYEAVLKRLLDISCEIHKINAVVKNFIRKNEETYNHLSIIKRELDSKNLTHSGTYIAVDDAARELINFTLINKRADAILHQSKALKTKFSA